MKIAINTRFLLKDGLEGVGWFTYEIVKRLVQQHPKDDFILIFDRPYHSDFIFGDNVTPIVLSPPARHPFLWYYWFEYVLPKALQQHQVDVFFSLDAYLSLRSPIPSLLAVHDIAFEYMPEKINFLARHYYQYFMPKYFRRADGIITVSNYTQNDIIQRYDLDASKISIVYNACREHFRPLTPDEQQAVREELTQGEAYFCYIGAVHPRKNVHRLIAAFDLFKQRHTTAIKLVIGGRFAWKTGLVKEAYEQASCKGDIIFTGYLEDRRLAKIMAAAYAFVYPSVFEGFGIPIVEAMNCAIPIITSNCTSMPEVASDAALLIDPYSIESISKALQQLYKNKELYKHLIDKGQVRKQAFSWDKSAKKVYARLQELAK